MECTLFNIISLHNIKELLDLATFITSLFRRAPVCKHEMSLRMEEGRDGRAVNYVKVVRKKLYEFSVEIDGGSLVSELKTLTIHQLRKCNISIRLPLLNV